ncbi:hypothetical protein MRB53_036980 [Persea americana]|nr:hypothetical protein MRB53_036980 [Persea americana]
MSRGRPLWSMALSYVTMRASAIRTPDEVEQHDSRPSASCRPCGTEASSALSAAACRRATSHTPDMARDERTIFDSCQWPRSGRCRRRGGDQARRHMIYDCHCISNSGVMAVICELSICRGRFEWSMFEEACPLEEVMFVASIDWRDLRAGGQ